LWDAGPQTTADDVVRLLRNRFGNQNQAERFRAELRARRRQKGESLQCVYQDVRRLIALAFPGQTGPLYEIVARDSFLDAIDNPAIRLRVLEREPSTLDEALTIASRLEALGFRAAESLPFDDDRRPRERLVRAVGAADEDVRRRPPDDDRLCELKGAVDDLRRQFAEERLSAERWRRQANGPSSSSSVAPPSLPSPVAPPSWLPPPPQAGSTAWPAPPSSWQPPPPPSPVAPPSWMPPGPSAPVPPPPPQPTGTPRPWENAPRRGADGFPRRGVRAPRDPLPRDVCRTCRQPGHLGSRVSQRKRPAGKQWIVQLGTRA